MRNDTDVAEVQCKRRMQYAMHEQLSKTNKKTFNNNLIRIFFHHIRLHSISLFERTLIFGLFQSSTTTTTTRCERVCVCINACVFVIAKLKLLQVAHINAQYSQFHFVYAVFFLHSLLLL